MADKIVVDASVAIKWLNAQNEDWLEKSDQLLNNAKDNKIELYAPEIIKSEIANALIYKKMNIAEAKTALETFYFIPINIILQTLQQAKETLKVAINNDIAFYDAQYLHLTRELKATLVTCDKHQQIPDFKVKHLTKYSLHD